jgi:hypothetical protein
MTRYILVATASRQSAVLREISKAANDVVELLDDRGIVSSSVAGVHGDDDEQRHGREFEPMSTIHCMCFGSPLPEADGFRATDARVPGF